MRVVGAQEVVEREGCKAPLRDPAHQTQEEEVVYTQTSSFS